MKRLLSALVLGGLVVALIAWAPRWAGALAVTLLVLAAAHEMAALVRAAGRQVAKGPALAGAVLMPAGAWAWGSTGLAAGLAAGLTLLFGHALLAGRVEGAVRSLSGAALLLLYPVWALSHAALYLETVPGRRALLFFLLCVWACDSAAFWVGSTVGRRKLAPRVSPNKTVAGAVAGALGAVGSAAVLKALGLVPWAAINVLLAGLCVAVLAQAGDLAESTVKRDAGVKDSGALIPGHGGILDRVDALLFLLPVFYYVLTLSGGLA